MPAHAEAAQQFLRALQRLGQWDPDLRITEIPVRPSKARYGGSRAALQRRLERGGGFAACDVIKSRTDGRERQQKRRSENSAKKESY
jgi:hypothetical protein